MIEAQAVELIKVLHSIRTALSSIDVTLTLILVGTYANFNRGKRGSNFIAY